LAVVFEIGCGGSEAYVGFVLNLAPEPDAKFKYPLGIFVVIVPTKLVAEFVGRKVIVEGMSATGAVGENVVGVPSRAGDLTGTDVAAASQGGSGVIINDGMFQKSAGAGRTTCYARFINNGTSKVSSETLDFEDAFTNSSGTIFLSGGSFRTVPPLWLTGGLLTGWGTVNGDVTNGATIRASRSNGVMMINGKDEQLLGGRLEFELGGTTPGIDQSRLNVVGTATLHGTAGVHWVEGYVPLSGTSFPVLTFPSHEGNFCCFDNFILLGQGRRLESVYTAASFTLTTVAASEPTAVPLRVTVDGAALVDWPMGFSGYELYWSTNLSQTNWTLIPGITNHFLESPPLPRENFFQLRKL